MFPIWYLLSVFIYPERCLAWEALAITGPTEAALSTSGIKVSELLPTFSSGLPAKTLIQVNHSVIIIRIFPAMLFFMEDSVAFPAFGHC